jgi:hypothetical protein
MLFEYFTSNRAPERQALLRAAAAVIIAYTFGVFAALYRRLWTCNGHAPRSRRHTPSIDPLIYLGSKV